MTNREQAIRSAHCYRALEHFMKQAGAENAIVTIDGEDLHILKEIKKAIVMLNESEEKQDERKDY